jgi:hypothetical protein
MDSEERVFQLFPMYITRNYYYDKDFRRRPSRRLVGTVSSLSHVDRGNNYSQLPRYRPLLVSFAK